MPFTLFRTATTAPFSRARTHATGRSLLLAALLLLAFSLTGCASQEPLKPYNPMGISGKVTPEAEKYFAMAHVLWKGGETCTEPEKAVAYLNKAIELQPDYWQAFARRGLAYSEMGLWDEAFDDLTRAVRQHPSAENYAWRGLVAFRMGNQLGARKDLARSIELDSAQHRAWNYRAAVELAEDEIVAACADFATGCSNGDCTGMESARREGICK
ncbi:tetratricopeptide repeat protein [Nitratidesulfovibrio sp.]|uniref:tetratricopeptide repeat protein n=1 Tax=Nitratidesulfovibrio sp. TaxID=2802297 RepID=UPI003342886D